MSESTPTLAPAVTWRVRVIRRVAASVGAAVVVAGVAPAIANAAGADVPNPVGIALSASGRGLSKAFGGASDSQACEATSSPAASVEPTETVSAAPDESSTEVVETALPSADPSSTEGSGDDGDADEECEASESPSETASASPTVEPTTEAPEAEDGNHGRIVSTVAKCAPRGKDPLLDVEGAPSNHGGYVRTAAHGDTLTTPWGTFDLSTQAGADALCAALDAARAELPDTEDDEKRKKAKKDKGSKGKGKRADR